MNHDEQLIILNSYFSKFVTLNDYAMPKNTINTKMNVFMRYILYKSMQLRIFNFLITEED